MAMKFVNSAKWKEAQLPFSQAVQVGDILFLSGVVGNIPGTGQLVPGGLEAEAHRALQTISETLAENGLQMQDVIKCTIMLTDMSRWAEFNAIYSGYFAGENPPSRSSFGANGLALGASVEIECWAYAGSRD